MNHFSSISVALILFSGTGFAAEKSSLHRRPTPSLPRIMHPALANDVFTLSLMSQIHSTLFEIGADHIPVPSLVEKFDVSEGGTLYRISIRQGKFHDGTILSSEIVKSSLEKAVKLKTSGHEKLGVIRGYQEFVSGKDSRITGIRVVSDRAFELQLLTASPQLIETLSDIHFAIVNPKSALQIGLGPYKVVDANSRHVLIEKTRELAAGAPDKVEFIPREKDAAIRDFISGNASDLFLYPLNEKDINRVKSYGHVTSVYFPRTYFLAANARKLESSQARSEILTSVDRSALIERCYPGNSLTENIVPPGFQGHVDGLKALSSSQRVGSSAANRSIRVGIAQGVDAESCVAKNLESMLGGAGFRATVKVEEADKLIDSWKKKELDILFAYLESENTLEMLQFFHPEASFSLGSPFDRDMSSLLSKYESSADPVQKKEVAVSISRSIAASSLVAPLFHPRQYLVYDKMYAEITGGLRSPNLIRVDALRTGGRK